MDNIKRINVLVAGTGASDLIHYLTLHNVQNKALDPAMSHICRMFINRAQYYLQDSSGQTVHNKAKHAGMRSGSAVSCRVIQKNEDGVYDLCMMKIGNGSINDADGLILVVPYGEEYHKQYFEYAKLMKKRIICIIHTAFDSTHAKADSTKNIIIDRLANYGRDILINTPGLDVDNASELSHHMIFTLLSLTRPAHAFVNLDCANNAYEECNTLNQLQNLLYTVWSLRPG